MGWMRFRKKEVPAGIVERCPQCGKTLLQKDLDANHKVCPACDHYFPLSAEERVRFLLDPDSFEEVDADLAAVDALEFVDKGPYGKKLEASREKTGRNDAMVIGRGTLRGRPLVFGAQEFSFMGGSMGVVVGEKVARAAELARERGEPLILVSASGGARMHEGALSLMQMAKSCAAIQRLHDAGGLLVCILAHPTTGGVTASWATMGDVLLAEPGALIGFAGPRVIKNTIRQDLPEGFQRSEFLLEKGQIDRIVDRQQLGDVIDQLFDYCLGPKEAEDTESEQAAPAAEDASPKSEAKTESEPKKGAKRAAPKAKAKAARGN